MALMAPPNQYRPQPAARTPVDPKIFLPPDFDQIAAKNGYHAETDGRVYQIVNGQKSYVPPWTVWQSSSYGVGPDGQLTPDGISHRLPGSDPTSTWNFMYSSGGPFTNRSRWDDSNGTYQGSVDWGTLLGTIAVGTLIGGGIAAVAGGGGSGGTAAVAAPSLEGTAAGTGATTTAAGLGTAPIGAEVGATTGGLSSAGLPGAVAAPTVGDLAVTGSSVPGLTAATTPAATTTAPAGSWLTSPTAQLISQGIGTAGQIYGANQAANATTDAARIQAQEADKALAAQQAELDYQHSQDSLKTNQYNDYLSRLNPYATTGQASSNRLSQFMGQPASAQTPLTINPPPNPLPAQRTTIPVTTAQQAGANSWGSTADANRTAAGGSPPDPQSQSTNGMATMQAPDGSIRQVPIGDVPRLFALGARRVDDGTISQAPPPASVPPGAIRAGTPNATGAGKGAI